MKIIHVFALAIATVSIALVSIACGGAQPAAKEVTPENEWDQTGMLSSGTVHYDLGDWLLTIDVPIEWKVASQTATMLMMQSPENEMISMSVLTRQGSTLDEVCPLFWKKLDESMVSIGPEQSVNAPNVVGRLREFEGDIPSMGGLVHMNFYCLKSGHNYLKLDVVANKDTYFQKPGLYSTILERFRFTSQI